MGVPGVTVFTALRRHDAELVRGRLEAAGLKAWLLDDGITAANPLLANAVGWIKVQVAAEDEQNALAALASGEQDVAESSCLSCGAKMAEGDEACPSCGWTYL
jgi:hypothetical protein